MESTARRRGPRGVTSIGVMFMVNAAMWTSIGPRLADLAERLGVEEGALGLALALQAVGLIAAMLVGPLLARRVGVKRMAVVAAVAYCLATALPGFTSTWLMFAAACLVSGIANGPLDLGMNRMATDLEERTGRSLMGRFEVWFNVGSLGSVLFATWAADFLSVSQHLTFVGLAGAVAILAFSRRLPGTPALETRAEAAEKALPLRQLARELSWPERLRVLALSAIAAVGLWAELMIPDWSSLLFAQRFGAVGSDRGWGAVFFTAGLLIALFAGDRLKERFGPRPVVLVGAVAFLAAMLALPLAGSIVPACALLFVAGLGIAPTHPFAISASGAMRARDLAQPVVMMAGYIGLSLQRPVNGLLAERFGLSAALTVSALLVGLIVLLCARVYGAQPERRRD